jgi:hypothetical protein
LEENPSISWEGKEEGQLKENGFEEKKDARYEKKERVFSVRFIGWENRRREDAYVIEEVRASA